ncbi:insulinase family protein [Candidatus Campbellbacteria bacterium]|nr:MAG: insulinase family protein [Candidatus Campbellbacteria bacterium]
MKYHKKVLPNGMRTIVAPMKDNPTVTVMVLVEAGSRYEDKRMNGISHFLEHMCFKGTPKRPHSGDISHELDSMGAESNAFTGDEVTGYWAKARAHQFDHILEIVSDLYLNPLLPEHDIATERGVIIEELNMYEDLPQRIVHDVLEECLYKGQSAGRPIIGSKENLIRFTRPDFIKYRTTHYVAPKTTLVVAGNVSVADAEKKIAKYFSHLPKAKYVQRAKTKENQKTPQILIKPKKTDQTHFLLGFRSFDLFDKRNPAVEVLTTILGRGMSSRLFRKLRDEMGVCYYVRAGSQTSTDTGVFKIASGVDTKRFEEVLSEILAQVRRLKNELVEPTELAKAKEMILGHTQMGLESSDDVANWFGEQEILHKKIQTPEEALKEISEVTAKDVQKVAREIFKNATLNLAAVGPVKKTPKLNRILNV